MREYLFKDTADYNQIIHTWFHCEFDATDDELEWLDENCNGNWFWLAQMITELVYFKNEEDKIKFILRVL